MARYVYLRLDPGEADLGRQASQIDTMDGYDQMFMDRLRSVDDPPEQRDRLVARLKGGDLVFVAACDRLATSIQEFLDVIARIRNAGADLVLMEESLDTRTAAGRHLLRVVESLARMDRACASARKKASIEAARRRGRRVGRPPVSIPVGFRDLCREWSEGRISGPEAVRRSGLRPTSFYKKARDLGFRPSRKGRDGTPA